MRNLNQLGFVTGLVLTEKAASFERVLFRATRGNMFLKLVHTRRKSLALHQVLFQCDREIEDPWLQCKCCPPAHTWYVCSNTIDNLSLEIY
jgi:hypothetical protein